MARVLMLCMMLWASLAATSQNIYDIKDFGAIGDGVADDAAAIQRAIDRCTADGGGKVLVPRGHTFIAGPICLKSNVELYLEHTISVPLVPTRAKG